MDEINGKTSIHDNMLDTKEIEDTLYMAGIGIWRLEYDSKNRPVYYSDSVSKDLFEIPNELDRKQVYSYWLGRVCEEYKDDLMRYFNEIKENGKSEVEYGWKHPSKGVIYIRCGGVIDTDENGSYFLRGYHHDITDRYLKDLKQQKKLAEQYSVIEAFSNAYIVVWHFDLVNNKVKVIRQADCFMDAAGQAQYDIRGSLDYVIENAVVAEDKFKMHVFTDMDNLCDQLRYNRSVSIEFRDKIVGWCRMTFAGVKRDAKGNVIELLGGSKSIAQEKQKELESKESIMKAYEDAKSANAAKAQFLARMSHDIRTPMNGILGMAQIAKNSLNDMEKVEDAIDKIITAGNQLHLLINDVLDMSRLESGKTELTKEVFNIKEIVDNATGSIDVMTKKHNVNNKGIHYDIIHENLIGSPLHVQRVILNVISNGIKYNKENGSLETWITEKPIGDNRSLFIFKIKDTGIGMSREYLDRIFEPFSREHTDAGTEYNGTGLGMAIMKELVDLMDGEIDIESEPGKGTTFIISIPFKISYQVAAKKKNENNVVEDFKGMTVLIAEDNFLNMEIAEYFLEKCEAKVIKAYDGKEAVGVFEHSEPGSIAFILMDVMMPGMDGIEATKYIRALNRTDAKTIPIIAMTAKSFREDKEQCLAAGMNGHISKPIDIKEMFKVINESIV